MSQSLTIPRCDDPLVDAMLPTMSPAAVVAFWGLSSTELDGITGRSTPAEIEAYAVAIMPTVRRNGIVCGVDDLAAAIHLRSLMLLDHDMQEHHAVSQSPLWWLP